MSKGSVLDCANCNSEIESILDCLFIYYAQIRALAVKKKQGVGEITREPEEAIMVNIIVYMLM